MLCSKKFDYLQSFARQIQRARKERGLSREELAEKAAVHPNTIGVAERAERDLNVLTQTRILAVLGCGEMRIYDDVYFACTGDGVPSPTRTDILAMRDAQIIRDIGKAIRDRRLVMDLRLEDVAQMAGLHINSVWNCERGLVVPDGNTVFRLYRVLGVSRLVAGERGLRLD